MDLSGISFEEVAMASLNQEYTRLKDEGIEEIQSAFHESSRSRIAAALGTLRHTLENEHQQLVEGLLNAPTLAMPSDSRG